MSRKTGGIQSLLILTGLALLVVASIQIRHSRQQTSRPIPLHPRESNQGIEPFPDQTSDGAPKGKGDGNHSQPGGAKDRLPTGFLLQGSDDAIRQAWEILRRAFPDTLGRITLQEFSARVNAIELGETHPQGDVWKLSLTGEGDPVLPDIVKVAAKTGFLVESRVIGGGFSVPFEDIGITRKGWSDLSDDARRALITPYVRIDLDQSQATALAIAMGAFPDMRDRNFVLESAVLAVDPRFAGVEYYIQWTERPKVELGEIAVYPCNVFVNIDPTDGRAVRVYANYGPKKAILQKPSIDAAQATSIARSVIQPMADRGQVKIIELSEAKLGFDSHGDDIRLRYRFDVSLQRLDGPAVVSMMTIVIDPYSGSVLRIEQ